MSNCEGCAGRGNCSKSGCCLKITTNYGKVKSVIGILSGKGGVGKSTVTAILAAKLRNAGYKVGVMDADITGPSIPRILGINNKRAESGDGEKVKFIPVKTTSGIRVISVNLLIEGEEQPVIWRGPVINGVLNQMFSDTEWGELDYLLIDMPPGTGDTALTIMQSFPLRGIVMVTTPQDMVAMIVKKAILMAEKLNVKIIGAVQNMSYIKCPKCGEKIKTFTVKASEDISEILGIPLLIELPIDPLLIENMEKGTIEKYINENWDYNTLIRNFLEAL